MKINQILFLGKQRGFTIKIKTWKNIVWLFLKNKFTIFLVVHSTEQ